MSNPSKNKITIIGDSTIDNKAWVSPGIIGNIIYNLLGIKRDSIEERIKKSHRKFWKTELSVVENLRDLLPGEDICDYTNDGFTTHDCLYGENRDKVFGTKLPLMFPHEKFAPLKAAKQDLPSSTHIILSVGGNNFREFLLRVARIENEQQKINFIKNNFDSVFEQLQKEYIEIINQIRAENKEATIILMTQYYPSFKQNNPFLHVYPFMRLLGKALNIGVNPDDPGDVIHEIMKKTYSAVLKAVPKEKIIVADITSSLDPFNKQNHTNQIEPSGVGGKKIAQVLTYLIKNNKSAGVYSFEPEFFSRDENDAAIKHTSLQDWVPSHPYSFKDAHCENLLNDLIKARDKFAKDSEMYKACHRVYCDGTALLGSLQKKSDATDLQQSLQLALAALNKPQDFNAIRDLKVQAKKTTQKGSSLWRSFAGGLAILAGTLSHYLAKVSVACMNVIVKNKFSNPTLGHGLIASGRMLMFNSPKQRWGKNLAHLADGLSNSKRQP